MISDYNKKRVFDALVQLRMAKYAEDVGVIGKMTKNSFYAANIELRKNGEQPLSSPEIHLTRKSIEHVNDSRTNKDSMTVKQIVNVMQRALNKRSTIDIDGAHETDRIKISNSDDIAIIVRRDSDGRAILVTVYKKEKKKKAVR